MVRDATRYIAIGGVCALVLTLGFALHAQERGKPDPDADLPIVYPSLSVDSETIRDSAASEKCFKCHGTEAESVEWARSGHAHNLEALRAAGNSHDSCLGCHSSGYRPPAPTAWGRQTRSVTVTLASAINEVACSSCHSHANKDQPGYLIRTPAETCGSCHKMDCGCAGKGIIHQSQSEMFFGILGRGVADAPSKHAEEMERACAVCHMYRPDGSDGVALEAGGHTFKATMESCVPCHDDAVERADASRIEIEALLATAEAALAAAPVASMSPQTYEHAKTNIDMVKADAGHGFHNPTYARLLLERTLEYLDVDESSD
jgi:hypothetical protein